jgi:hypothetical protein
MCVLLLLLLAMFFNWHKFIPALSSKSSNESLLPQKYILSDGDIAPVIETIPEVEINRNGILESFSLLIDYLPSDYERSFTSHYMHPWFIEDSFVWGVVGLYSCLCLFGTQGMKSFPAVKFKLRYLSVCWHGLFSVFNLLGACRTVPYLLRCLLTESFESSMCRDPFVASDDGTVGFWSLLFILSKIPQLLEIVILILEKENSAIFLCYPRVSELLFCWHAHSTHAASGLYFIAMNYTLYFFLYGGSLLNHLQVEKTIPFPSSMAITAMMFFVRPIWCLIFEEWGFIVSFILSLSLCMGFVFSKRG